MTASMGVMPHIWRASEPCKPSCRHRRGISITIHLKRCSDKGVHGILTRKVTENTVRALAAISAIEEDIGASADVFIHSNFASERMNALNPATLNRWNQCGVRIQRKMFADLSAKSESLSIGREKKFNRSCVETNSVIECLNLMSLIDATDDHHCGQDLKIGDVAGITGEKGFHNVWLVGLYNDIDPGTGYVAPRQCVYDLVHLHDHNRVVEGGGLNNHRSIFGIGPCKQIAFLIRLLCANQYHVRDKVYE